MPPSAETTPMLRQYQEIKSQYPDAILFYRIGDFYEMFYDDAVTASKALDIVLTSRNKNDPNPVPLCGIPHHSYQPYLQKLIEKGYKVAICDQVEDPKSAKGVVKREVTRVVTPGLAGHLEGSFVNRLVGLFQADEKWGIALLDMTTGDFRVSEIPHGKNILDELLSFEPREIVLPDGLEVTRAGESFCISRLPEWVWNEAFARKTLYDQFGVTTLSGFRCEDLNVGVIAAGALLHYVKETQKITALPNIRSLKRQERGDSLTLTEEGRANLSWNELLTLFDQTKTAMGGRRLREWFHAPLRNLTEIQGRLDAVEELTQKPFLTEALLPLLAKVYDLEKINNRLVFGTANARDLRALGDSLTFLEKATPLLSEFQSTKLKGIHSEWEIFPKLREKILNTLVDEPPWGLKEGGLIREGVHPELDELHKIQRDAKSVLSALEERERSRTGIGSLKIHYNRVFGYYLEVSAAQLAKVPIDFVRKQTLANAERFITPELKDLENKILGAEEKIKALEYQIFCDLREEVMKSVSLLQSQAEQVGYLDAFLSLGLYARQNRTVKPVMQDSGVLKIKKGRHPLVERHLSVGSFVPNDLSLDIDGERFLMITGPNMAGKSTAIRQTGVIVLLAQIGSFVPAEEARIGVVDQIFTRVGASDRLARGESTFMVEMCETAAILHHATDRSLILLDEIGRGTSTFDGISIAWAVAEYLHDHIRARTLFATHYHELADLAATCSGIKNYNVQVKEEGDQIVFLYRLMPGSASHSYGIHVARLAGLPVEVVDRAKEILKNLEQNELSPEGTPRIGKKRKKEGKEQGSLF